MIVTCWSCGNKHDSKDCVIIKNRDDYGVFVCKSCKGDIEAANKVRKRLENIHD